MQMSLKLRKKNRLMYALCKLHFVNLSTAARVTKNRRKVQAQPIRPGLRRSSRGWPGSKAKRGNWQCQRADYCFNNEIVETHCYLLSTRRSDCWRIRSALRIRHVGRFVKWRTQCLMLLNCHWIVNKLNSFMCISCGRMKSIPLKFVCQISSRNFC